MLLCFVYRNIILTFTTVLACTGLSLQGKRLMQLKLKKRFKHCSEHCYQQGLFPAEKHPWKHFACRKKKKSSQKKKRRRKETSFSVKSQTHSYVTNITLKNNKRCEVQLNSSQRGDAVIITAASNFMSDNHK